MRPPELLERHVAEYGDSLARLVPALGTAVADPGAVVPRRASPSATCCFGRSRACWRRRARGGPVLLVLEDLHWADPPTLKLLRRLLTSPRPLGADAAVHVPGRRSWARTTRCGSCSPICTVSRTCSGWTCADSERGRRGAAAGDLAMPARVAPIEQLVSARSRPAPTATRSSSPSSSASLAETGALVSEGGRWHYRPASISTAQLPVSISETLARRLRRMGDDVRRCLRVAAVIGEEFDLDLVSEVADAESASRALELAVDGGRADRGAWSTRSLPLRPRADAALPLRRARLGAAD